MIDTAYAYLVASLLYLGIWFVLMVMAESFVRRAMVAGGVLFCWLGPLGQALWFTHDWWQPVSAFPLQSWLPEDWLLTFAHIGIVVAVYPVLLRRTTGLSPQQVSLAQCGLAFRRLGGLLLVSMVVAALCWYGFGLHSSVASSLGMLAGGAYLSLRRPDLFPVSVTGAIVMVVVTWPVFWLTAIIKPGWVARTWMMENLTGLSLLAMPLEDMMFYAASGFQCGALLAFMFGIRLRPRP